MQCGAETRLDGMGKEDEDAHESFAG
jgi:hypothetical protein